MSSQNLYADETNVLSEAELTPEQKETLAKLNQNMSSILARIDAVLKEFGIDRQVHQFTTTRQRVQLKEEDSVGPMWCCCVYGPPDEAPCDECPKAPRVLNGGTE